LEDSHACGDDVSWEVSDEQHVAIHEVVVDDERFEVGTWNDRDLPAGAIEVGGDGILMTKFGVRDVDVAERGGASGW
jgi:hypothetical protein